MPAMAAPCWFQPQGEGRVAAIIDARSFRLGDGREIKPRRHRARRRRRLEPQRGLVRAHRRTRCDACAATTMRRTATAARPPFVFLSGSETIRCRQRCSGKARRWFPPIWPTRTALAALLAAEAAGREAKKGHLGRPTGHKKRGKSRRYFGREWAFYAGRRQGSVGTTGRGNHLSEFRPELDTGLCCDYFKAHATVFRGGGHRA